MTEPRTPDDGPVPADPVPAEPGAAASVPAGPGTTEPRAGDPPTQAWPSLATPAASTTQAAPPSPAVPTSATTAVPPAAASPYEPASSLPGNRVSTVGETGTFGATATAGGRRTGLRWAIAIVGVVLVAAASILVVSLVGAKVPVSTVMGYMPDQVMTYTEVRLDLPGDQRQKLASFLKPVPGFDDSSQFDTKLNELLDRFVAAASDNKQTWTADIAPWFGGQVGIGVAVPPSVQPSQSSSAMASTPSLFVLSITDRAKAIAWIEKVGDAATINRSTYGDADLLIPTAGNGQYAVAVNDKVAIAGQVAAVKAAVDTGGKSEFSNTDDVKAALGTVDKDYVMLGVTRVKALADAFVRLMASSSPGTLDQTQLDDTVVGMLPAWFANTARFENDSLVMTSVGPAGSIGYDTSNHADQVIGHIPAGTLLVTSEHDVGPSLTAIVAKFRALPETSDFFRQVDQGLALLGGFDAVFGWWGDSAVVVSKVPDGTIGGGLVIKPRDAAAADRFMTSINGFATFGGASAGATVRTDTHNGTKVTVLDFSASAAPGSLPPGYKAEVAWAANADIAVIGYGEAFVNAVLDSGPGSSLADDARFKGLLDRVNGENIAVTFVDLKAIRTMLEPLAEQAAPAADWDQYVKNIQPYLQPIDALIATGRKDGSLDRGVSVVTTPR